MIEIKHKDTGEVLHQVDADTLRGVNRNKTDLRGANLHNADLSQADLYGADLSGLNLREAKLSGANLSWTDLSGADLSGSNLLEANLTSANLCNTTLIGTNLTGARVIRADLNDAKLIGTELFLANLSESNLARADLREADFNRTSISDCRTLHLALNLVVAKHSGPSYLDVATLRASIEQLPLVFLQGIGLTDEEIRNFRDLYVANPIQFYSCFISYSHQDKSFARRLFDALQGKGIRCWLDEHQVLPGDDIFEQVDRGIRMWDKVLLCASEHSLTSWWVDNEIDTAFSKEQKLMKSRGGKKAFALIPLNLDGFMFSGKWQNGKAQQVKSRLAADFTGWETDNAKFEEQFARLVKAMRTDDGGREEPPPSRL